MNTTPNENNINPPPAPPTFIPSQPISTPPPPSSPSQKPFLVIGILLLLILTAGSAYFLGKSQKNPNIVTLSPTPTSTLPIASPTSNPTADWKTYSNNKYQISFKYPDDYFRYTSPSEDTVYLAPSAGNGEAYGSPMGLEKKDIWLSVSINPTDNDLSIEQFLALPEMVDYKNAQKEAITIANRSGYKVTIDKPSGPEGVVYYEGLVKNGKNIYRLEMSSFMPEALVLQQETFDQILSTFKFLDEKDELSCQTDSDCDVELCGCKAKNKNFIDKSKNICTVMCGTPTCTNNKCLVQPYKGY